MNPTSGSARLASGVERWSWRFAVVGLIVLGWSALCTAPGVPWNAARLAPSFALARGLPIYSLRDSAAHLGWFYGPGLPLWFLPCGLVENPTVGLMLAVVWNAATLLLAFYFILRAAFPGHKGMAVRLTLLGAVLLLANRTTQASFFMLHVDGVCVACVLGAFAALHAAAIRGWRPGLPVAALALAYAVATKQLAILAVPATVVWLWRERRAALLGRWFFWLLVCGGVLAGGLLAGFGAEPLLFNAVVVHQRNLWQGGFALLVENLGRLTLDCWPWLVSAGVVGYFSRTAASATEAGQTTAENSGAMIRLLLWAAVWQAPAGFTASLKVGGGTNSVHAIFYLLAAGLVWLGARWLRPAGPGDPAGGRLQSRAVPVVVLVGLVAAVVYALSFGVVWRPNRVQEDLVARARAAQGKLYLPWNPLTTVVADRKIYPFDDALLCLWRAGLEPAPATIRAALPPGAVIFYHEPSQSHFALNYFGPEARAAAEPKRTEAPR